MSTSIENEIENSAASRAQLTRSLLRRQVFHIRLIHMPSALSPPLARGRVWLPLNALPQHKNASSYNSGVRAYTHVVALCAPRLRTASPATCITINGDSAPWATPPGSVLEDVSHEQYEAKYISKLPGRELSPGLPRDRRKY